MQNNEQKLESVTETVIAIPFGGSDDESNFEDDAEDELQPGHSFPCVMYTPTELASCDLPDGPHLRMKVYRNAFGHCRDRMQEVLRRIHEPTIRRVIDIVQDAYEFTEEDRLMPYTELRVVAISGTDRSATLAVIDELRHVFIGSQLEADHETEHPAENLDDLRFGRRVIVSVLTSTDCSSLTSAMKAMISGFLETISDGVDGEEDGRQIRRVLAPYDINLLENWYDRLRQTRDEADLPKLVVLVTDLEKIEPTIMQDIFYICSLHVPRLPFIFILGLSSPTTPSYMHSAFPRKTLALLQLTCVEVASGMDILTRVLKDTFFHPGFEPTIMPSPAVLSFIGEHYNRTVRSIDFVISLLQLVHLRHFTDPFSVLARDELLGAGNIEEAAEKLSAPSGHPFLHPLLARLRHLEKTGEEFINGINRHDDIPRKDNAKSKGKGKATVANDVGTDVASALGALRRVREIRQKHEERLQRSRVAFVLVSEIRGYLLERGSARISDRDRGAGAAVGTEMDLLSSWFRGTVPSKLIRAFEAGLYRELSSEAGIKHLLRLLQDTVEGLPAETVPERDETFRRFERWGLDFEAAEYNPDPDSGADERSDIFDELCKRFADCIRENAYDFTDEELWDIWYTGNPTGISEIFNPAPRAAIINALVHPERYLGNKEPAMETPSPSKGKGKHRAEDCTDDEKLIPDTALLFKGYLESGRMVNVYDWYTSFKEGLDSRRRSERRTVGNNPRMSRRGKKDRQNAVRDSSINGSAPPSPTKGRGRGRGTRGRGTRGGKSRGRPITQPESDDSADESETGDEGVLDPEERERWEGEVQARFIRSVQELDLLGFIKHTGRKADHVQKTVYELPDYA